MLRACPEGMFLALRLNKAEHRGWIKVNQVVGSQGGGEEKLQRESMAGKQCSK